MVLVLILLKTLLLWILLRIYSWDFFNQPSLVSSKIVELCILQLPLWINKNSWHLSSEPQPIISITVSLLFQTSGKQFNGHKMWNNVGYAIGLTKLKAEICSMFNKIIFIIRSMVLHFLVILQKQLSVILFVVYVMLTIISRWVALILLGKIRKSKFESQVMTSLFYVLLNMQIK